MTYSRQLNPSQRSTRIKLAGSVLALILLDNQRQVRAPLHQLSLNGGLLCLPEPLEAATVEVMFHLGSTTVRAKAETMLPLWATQGCLQPFRFTGLDPENREQLEGDLHSLLGIRRVLATPPSEPEEMPEEILDEQPGPSQVILYFDTSQDALRFTVAFSTVIAREMRACTREDLAKLAQEIGKVNRVTATGVHRPVLSAVSQTLPSASLH